MSDVLRDPKVTEFLETRWAEVTTYGQQEILKSIDEFLLEKTGNSILDDEDEDEVDDWLGDDDDLEDEVDALKKRVAIIEGRLNKAQVAPV